MKSNLILYYSRSGSTKIIAELLREKLNADIIEITDNINRKGFFGLFRTMKEGIKKTLPEIFPKDLPVEKYNYVIIGSPVWGGTVSSPIAKLFNEYKSKLKKIAVFVTCLGGLSEVGKNFIRKNCSQHLEKGENIELLQITKKEIKNKTFNTKLDDFIKFL